MTFKQNLRKDARYIAKNNWAREETLMRADPGEGYVKFSSNQQAQYIQIIREEDR